MKKVKILFFIIIFLIINLSLIININSDSPPPLPLIVYGKIVYDDDTIAYGVSVKVSWQDDDHLETLVTETLTEQEAKNTGYPEFSGYYIFSNDKFISNSIKKVNIEVGKENLSLEVMPGIATKAPDILIKKTTILDNLENLFKSFFFPTNGSITSPIKRIFKPVKTSDPIDQSLDNSIPSPPTVPSSDNSGLNTQDSSYNNIRINDSSQNFSGNEPLDENNSGLNKSLTKDFSQSNSLKDYMIPNETEKPNNESISNDSDSRINMTSSISHPSDQNKIYNSTISILLGSQNKEYLILIILSFSLTIALIVIIILINCRKNKLENLPLKKLRGIETRRFMNKEIIQLNKNSNILDALEIFLERNINAIFITSSKTPIGFVTKKDILEKINDYSFDSLKNTKLNTILRKDFSSIRSSEKLVKAYDRFIKSEDCIAIVENNSIIGVIDLFDILRVFSKANFSLENPILVREAMTKKVVYIEDSVSLKTLKQRFISEKEEYFIVLKNKEIKGIVTLKDFISAVYKDFDLEKTSVKDITTYNMITMTPGTSLDKALNLTLDRKFNQIPVLEDKKIVGILKLREIAKTYYDSIDLIASDGSYTP